MVGGGGQRIDATAVAEHLPLELVPAIEAPPFERAGLDGAMHCTPGFVAVLAIPEPTLLGE